MDEPSKLLLVLNAWLDRIVKVNDELTGKARANMESNPASEISVDKTIRSKLYQNRRNLGAVSKSQSIH